MAESGSNKKVPHSLVALSSAAVLAVYAAGYLRTKSAADRFALQAVERRPLVPAPPLPARAADPIVQVQPAVPNARTAEPSLALQPAADPPHPASTAANGTTAPAEPSLTTLDVQNSPAVPLTAETSAPLSPVTAGASQPVNPSAGQKAAEQYKDGTYLGWGMSRHGDIQAAVVIEGGRIASARIAQCLTRYSCDVIADLPPQVALRQNPDVDSVSGATQSADAFYFAVVEALSKAK